MQHMLDGLGGSGGSGGGSRVVIIGGVVVYNDNGVVVSNRSANRDNWREMHLIST